VEVLEQQGLQLRMQVCFGFFDQEECQILVTGRAELDQHRGDEEQVGVAEAGLGEVAGLQAVVAHPHAEGPGDREQIGISEAEVAVLGAGSGSDFCQRCADCAARGFEDRVLRCLVEQLSHLENQVIFCGTCLGE
jgi:hypothetical protein